MPITTVGANRDIVTPTVLPEAAPTTEVPAAVRSTAEEKIQGVIDDYSVMIGTVERERKLPSGVISGLVKANLSRLDDSRLNEVLEKQVVPGSKREPDPSFMEKIRGTAVYPDHTVGIESDPKGDKRYGLGQVQIRQAAAAETEGFEVNSRVRTHYGAIKKDLLDPERNLNALGDTLVENIKHYSAEPHGRSEKEILAFALAKTMSNQERGEEIGTAQNAAAREAVRPGSKASELGLSPDEARYNWEITAEQLRKTNPRLVEAVESILLELDK